MWLAGFVVSITIDSLFKADTSLQTKYNNLLSCSFIIEQEDYEKRENTLYNIYDAGNFMTGKAFQLVDVPLKMLKAGAHLNNIITSRSRGSGDLLDSDADQSALKSGYNYKGVKWKSK